MKGRNLVILTGAGISAESGVPTFRDADGLCRGHRFEEVASPEAFARDPALVHEFYNLRRAALKTVEPNAAHRALAELAARWEGDFLLVTQNVDDLHDRALAEVEPGPGFDFIHMHGEMRKARCTVTDKTLDWSDDLSVETPSPFHAEGRLRPHIVWFGEYPFGTRSIEGAVEACDLFVSIGTSGSVYPAAGYAWSARRHGARTLELNLEPSANVGLFEEARQGPATELVPAFVAELLT